MMLLSRLKFLPLRQFQVFKELCARNGDEGQMINYFNYNITSLMTNKGSMNSC